MLWQAETDGYDFSTPERRAGLERSLAAIVAEITDGKIADYYRRDFEQKVFDVFKARKPRTPDARRSRLSGPPRPAYATGQVSAALKQSALGRAAHQGRSREAALKVKETELATLLMARPALALSHGELLAGLPFQDPSLDMLRRELLNLAASGSTLEKPQILTHFVRLGMAELLARLGASEGAREPEARPEAGEEAEARFLRAASDLREMAEWEPERARAFERLGSEASEEAWREAKRFLRAPGE
jgi:DNA primase